MSARTQSKVLFNQAEVAYVAGQTDEAFEIYQRCIKKILKDEILIQKAPPGSIIPDDCPEEILAAAWVNFAGMWKEFPKFNKDNYPEAYKLLHSFRASTDRSFPRFKGDKAKVILKAMQIEASFTLGLLAWDKKDRATAAKRY
ncbi:hypothetical protein AX16_004686 [Volvariella volvacea WC 439]|nr:hypothetical protein AX16_004686 [Volvariella volvacea WC 439]